MLGVIGSCTFRYAAKARIFHVCNMSAAARQEFQLRETKGDLFECPATDSLAHCVSKDLHMGKGIAVIFKKKFGGVDKLKAQKKDVGDVAVLEHDQRYVYYLITKPRFFNKPTLQTLEKSLQAMKSHCEENKVSSLAMPMIGCGLDKLEWNKVSALIKDVFKDLPMTITVYTIPSKGEQSNPSNCCTKYPKQEA